MYEGDEVLIAKLSAVSSALVASLHYDAKSCSNKKSELTLELTQEFNKLLNDA